MDKCISNANSQRRYIKQKKVFFAYDMRATYNYFCRIFTFYENENITDFIKNNYIQGVLMFLGIYNKWLASCRCANLLYDLCLNKVYLAI